MKEDSRDYYVPREAQALLSDERLILRETGRAVTPFGGVGGFCGDRALHALLGVDRFPSDDTIRNLFRRFTMGNVQRLFEPLAQWNVCRSAARATRWI